MLGADKDELVRPHRAEEAPAFVALLPLLTQAAAAAAASDRSECAPCAAFTSAGFVPRFRRLLFFCAAVLLLPAAGGRRGGERYGMVNHMVYDVFQKGKHGHKDSMGLRATSRFGENFEEFNSRGLEFRCGESAMVGGYPHKRKPCHYFPRGRPTRCRLGVETAHVLSRRNLAGSSAFLSQKLGATR